MEHIQIDNQIKQMVVTRNGNLDMTYVEALEAAAKRELLMRTGKQAIEAVGRSMLAVGYAVTVGLERMMLDLEA